MGVPTLIRLIKLENLLYIQFPKKTEYYHLHLLAVLPDAQGKGYAKGLLIPILDEMNSIRRLIFLEIAAIKNVKIYEKLGYSTIHVQRHGDFDVHIIKRQAIN